MRRRVTVDWENTNLPYTVLGPRRHGTFTTNLIYAYLWAHVFCFCWPRAAVHVSWAEKTGSAS